MSDTRNRLEALLRERILVLDGAWGTMLQRAGLEDADYRGERFADHPRDVAGDPDLLNLTRPDVVLDIHRRYLAAGADITTTNTFTATSIGQADYGLEGAVHDMNVAGARLARQAADEVGGRFVAGSLGPLNVTLSLSPKVDDPAYRAVTFDQVGRVVRGADPRPREGGVDLLLIETIFDTLNAKAAIAAAKDVAPELPLWISVTIVDLSGRTLSGQTVEAFWNSIEEAKPLIVGRQLLARREGDAAARRRALAARRHVHELASERRPPERLRRLRRAAARHRRAARLVRARRASSTSSAAAAGRRPSTSARSQPRSTGRRRDRSRSVRRGRGSAASSRSRSAPTPAS